MCSLYWFARRRLSAQLYGLSRTEPELYSRAKVLVDLRSSDLGARRRLG
jgi:hypothetical protein